MRTNTILVLVVGLLVGSVGAILLTSVGPINVTVDDATSSSAGETPAGPVATDAGGGTASPSQTTVAIDASGEDTATEAPTETDVANVDLDGEIVEELVIEEVNTARTSRDLTRVNHSDQLDRVAEGHTAEMIEHDYFARVPSWDDGIGEQFARHNASTCDSLDPEAGEYIGPREVVYRQTVTSSSEQTVAREIVRGVLSDGRGRDTLLEAAWSETAWGVQTVQTGNGTEVIVTGLFC